MWTGPGRPCKNVSGWLKEIYRPGLHPGFYNDTSMAAK